MKATTIAALTAAVLLAPLQIQAATVFLDEFDAAGDGRGAGSFDKAWTVEGTLWGGAGTESITDKQPQGAPHTDPNWAFFQTNGSNGSGINIDTGVLTVASQDYEFSFLTGGKDTQPYTGTMTAQLWDWDGVGTLTADGTLIGSFVATNADYVNNPIESNSSTLTSAATTEGNLYVRFDVSVNGTSAFAQPLIDNVLVATVPEPSAAMLGLLGCLAFGFRRRK